MRLLFASNNAHKLEEVRKILPQDVCVLSLQDVGFEQEIDEPGETLEENSAIKARTIAAWLEGRDLDIDGVFADDTGLEIHALGGKPGVRTARWAGEDCKAENNRAKAIREMADKEDRSARFRTVVTLIRNHQEQQVDGCVRGSIARAEYGQGGFGYDPVFIPEGYDKTFAELPAETKNSISHRARAMEALRKLLLVFGLLLSVGCYADGLINQFRLFPSYANTTSMQTTAHEVFGLSNGAIYSIDMADNAITKYDKTDGLSGSTVTHIAYDPQTQKLVVTYSDGHIDLLRNGTMTQLPDLYLKAEEINTTIHSLYANQGVAYLSMGIGIVALNLEKEEVIDTYPMSDGVLYTVRDNDSIWCVNTGNLFLGNARANLIDYNSWTPYPLPSTLKNTITGLEVMDSTIYLLKGGEIWQWRDESWSCVAAGNIRWIRVVNGVLLAANEDGVFDVRTGQTRFNVAGARDITYSDAGYYLSTGQTILQLSESGQKLDEIAVSGPMDNNANNLYISQRRLYVASGDYKKDRKSISGSVKIMDLDGSNRWTNISEQEICNHVGTDQMPNFWDACSITEDKDDPTHFFVASYGMGIMEFRDDRPYRQFTDSCATPHSTLSSAVGSGVGWQYYTRCSSLATDEDGYIWAINTETTPVHIYDIKNEKWSMINLGNNIIDVPGKRILVDNRHPNWKWILYVAPTGRSTSGIILLDDNGTPTYSGDDRVIKRSEFVDQKGKVISPTDYHTLAQDNRGVIWVGTDKGPFYIDHENFFTSNRCSRIIRRRNDGTDLADYLLETEVIKTIAIDGGNRKWFGTDGSGVFVVSDDGQETIYEFTEKNSNLPSSIITSIAIDPDMGDVYIGTSAGLCCYRTDASAGHSDMSKAYAYPNPVRPDYQGDIVIGGLMVDSWVNIFDAGGNLVYKTMSNGGSAIWNGCNGRGDRVASGIYTAVCTSAHGSGQNVVKILFMH